MQTFPLINVFKAYYFFDSLHTPGIDLLTEMDIRSPFSLACVTDPAGDDDKTKLVVGIVVGLLVAAVVIGVAYWVYMKKSK